MVAAPEACKKLRPTNCSRQSLRCLDSRISKSLRRHCTTSSERDWLARTSPVESCRFPLGIVKRVSPSIRSELLSNGCHCRYSLTTRSLFDSCRRRRPIAAIPLTWINAETKSARYPLQFITSFLQSDLIEELVSLFILPWNSARTLTYIPKPFWAILWYFPTWGAVSLRADFVETLIKPITG